MRFSFFVIFALCFLQISVGAQGSSAIAGQIALIEGRSRFVSAPFPEDIPILKELVLKENEVAISNKLLEMCQKRRQSVAASHTEKKARVVALESMLNSWILTLRFYQIMGDPRAKERIISGWNQSLEDDPAICYQLAAIAFTWDRVFLTSDFWKLFYNTKSKLIIRTYCSMLIEHGNTEDLQEIYRRAEQSKSVEIRGILLKAANDLECKLDPSRGIPQIVGPTVPTPEEIGHALDEYSP